MAQKEPGSAMRARRRAEVFGAKFDEYETFLFVLREIADSICQIYIKPKVSQKEFKRQPVTINTRKHQT